MVGAGDYLVLCCECGSGLFGGVVGHEAFGGVFFEEFREVFEGGCVVVFFGWVGWGFGVWVWVCCEGGGFFFFFFSRMKERPVKLAPPFHPWWEARPYDAL